MFKMNLVKKMQLCLQIYLFYYITTTKNVFEMHENPNNESPQFPLILFKNL